MSGNAIPLSSPIARDNYGTVIQLIKNILPSGLEIYPFGSAGKKDISGDIDLFIEATDLMSIFSSADVKQGRKSLEEYFKKQGLCSNRSGVSVHVGVPFEDAIIQIDFMAVDDAINLQKLHDHDYSNTLTNGKTIVSLWCDLANATSPTLMISPYRGLVNRQTKELISIDKDEIAKIIISDDAIGDDMSSPDKILSSLLKNQPKYKIIKEKYDNYQKIRTGI